MTHKQIPEKKLHLRIQKHNVQDIIILPSPNNVDGEHPTSMASKYTKVGHEFCYKESHYATYHMLKNYTKEYVLPPHSHFAFSLHTSLGRV